MIVILRPLAEESPGDIANRAFQSGWTGGSLTSFGMTHDHNFTRALKEPHPFRSHSPNLAAIIFR